MTVIFQKTLKYINMKNLGFGLLCLFIISIGGVTAATLSSESVTTSISCDKEGEKCCKKKKKKKKKCKKDKEACKGKSEGTSTEETK